MDIPFPLEFLIEGVPASAQSTATGRERWKRTVAAAAASRLREVSDGYLYDARPLAITIYYFPVGTMRRDVDNIVKPILDGMILVAHPNDNVVERVVVQKIEAGARGPFGTVPPKLGEALRAAPPLVYVRIEADFAWRQIA